MPLSHARFPLHLRYAKVLADESVICSAIRLLIAFLLENQGEKIVFGFFGTGPPFAGLYVM